MEKTEISAYMGDTKGGSFDIPGTLAAEMLAVPPNPNGRSNSDVIKPWVNASDIGGHDRWYVDHRLWNYDS